MADSKENRSFEFSEWNFVVHRRAIKVVAVYRPPYSVAHPVSSSVFFDEFSTYLENIVMSSERLLITGDFNFHPDCLTDNDAKRFVDLLETFGLIQHVLVPTHSSGHTLDLIITRSTNDIAITGLQTTLLLSDHLFIEFNCDIPRPNLSVSEVQFRKLRQINVDAFKADISSSKLYSETWTTVDELAKCYDDTLSDILDKHAPVKRKVMVVRPRVPWFTNNLKRLKAKRRYLEREMVKSGLRATRMHTVKYVMTTPLSSMNLGKPTTRTLSTSVRVILRNFSVLSTL